jgi:hypothetical protein
VRGLASRTARDVSDTEGMERRGAAPLSRRVRLAIATRFTLEGTRRRTRLERLTVARLSWDQLVRLNRDLELAGKLTTAVWLVFIVTVALGVDWKDVVEGAVNSGRPVKGAIVLALVIPTLIFVAARSLVGFGRWRLQREFWRREVERGDTR